MTQIHIIEGPSGAGKSTFIRQAVQAQPTGTVAISSSLQVLTGSRLPSKVDEGAIFSASNDLYKALKTLQAVKGGAEEIYIDRFFISQVVYGLIRKRQEQWHYEELPLYRIREIKHFIQLIFNSAREHALWRGLDLPFITPLDWEITIIWPRTYEELERRRSMTGKDYPAEQSDWAIYGTIANSGLFGVIDY